MDTRFKTPKKAPLCLISTNSEVFDVRRRNPLDSGDTLRFYAPVLVGAVEVSEEVESGPNDALDRANPQVQEGVDHRRRRQPAPLRAARPAERPDRPGSARRRLPGLDARQAAPPGRSSIRHFQAAARRRLRHVSATAAPISHVAKSGKDRLSRTAATNSVRSTDRRSSLPAPSVSIPSRVKEAIMAAEKFPRRWRSYLRFSVRALLVAVLVIGGGVAWIVRSARAQREAVWAIRGAHSLL